MFIRIEATTRPLEPRTPTWHSLLNEIKERGSTFDVAGMILQALANVAPTLSSKRQKIRSRF